MPMRGFECGAGRRIRTDLPGLEAGGTHCAFLRKTVCVEELDGSILPCRNELDKRSAQCQLLFFANKTKRESQAQNVPR